MENFPKLINTEDNSTIIINNSVFSIGRSLSCNHIIECLGVSRFHCIIKKSGIKWTLFDRSTNGTNVNGALIKYNESVDLKCGDIIKLPVVGQNLEFKFVGFNSSESSTEGQESEATTIEENVEIVLPDCSNSHNLKGIEDRGPSDLDDEINSLQALAQEFEIPFEQTTPAPEITTTGNVNKELVSVSNVNNVAEEEKHDDNNHVKSEFCCSICSELYIKAVTLNCSHTFCRYCIEEWKRNKSVCPICRATMTTIVPTRVLDNFIERIVANSTEDEKNLRKEIIQNREEKAPIPGPSNIKKYRIIEVSSDDEEVEYHSDHFDEVDWEEEVGDGLFCYDDIDETDEDDEVTYNGIPGRFYGGYGRCFICGDRGHWANGCPNVHR